MREFGRVMIAIDWLFTMACGIALLYLLASVPPELKNDFLHVPRPGLVVAGVAVLLLNFIWLIVAVKSLGYEEYIISGTDAGQVKVAVSAIEESLTRTALAQPEVSSARVRAVLTRDSRSASKIRVTVAFYEVPNQLGAQQMLQSVLRERFKEIVHSDVDVPVDIHVARFAAEKKRGDDAKRRQAQREEDRDDEEEFHGPRYPSNG